MDPHADARPVLLSARGLACGRGGQTLITDADLDLHAGELLWLRGTNGRGKTTLLRVLAGLTPPWAGEVRGHAAGEVLWLGHANALKDDLDAGEALDVLLRLHGAPHDPAARNRALRRWGLEAAAARPVRQLSQGQRRRLALARLDLQPAARVWLLDEPFDALDDAGCRTLTECLHEHLDRAGAVLLTSHLPVPGLQAAVLRLDPAEAA